MGPTYLSDRTAKKYKFQPRRLQKLADTLVTVPRKRFNIEMWATGKFCNITNPPEAGHNECGATGCAFGWACTVPSFRKAGLHMSEESNGWGSGRSFVPRYKGRKSFAAAQAFFGLSIAEVQYLFSMDNVNSAKKAATRIEKLIALRKVGKTIEAV